MTQLLFIETFVFGASIIAAIYHLVLFIQQRDKFLLFYSLYLFSLATYIGFKLISKNYDPFLPTDNVWFYVLEEVLQVWMVSVYVLFAAVTLEVIEKRSIVRTLMSAFLILSILSIGYHIATAVLYGPGVKSVVEYAISRISLVGIATLALLFAWRIRTTVFQRTIIIGSLVYDFSGLLSIISFTQNAYVFGLKGVEPYLVGCLLDIIIFSSALGYRIKKIAEEKNELLKKEISSQRELLNERKRISLELHDDLGSGLSTIRFLSEVAKDQTKDGASKVQLEKISSMSNDLIDNMRQIVWTMSGERNTLNNFIHYLKKYIYDYLDNNNIGLELHIQESVDERLLAVDVRRNVFLVVKECLHNVAKHSNASQVTLTIVVNDTVKIVLYDNGIGITLPPSDHTGHGLVNMQKRMEVCNGTFRIENNQGTIVTLQF